VYSHRRRSDWNSGGGARMAELTIKVLLYRQKHIFLHCNASNLVLKILQHDKMWEDNHPLQILPPRDLRP